MSMTEGEHLTDEREADLVAGIASQCEDAGTLDRMLCVLIELGLCNPDAAAPVLEAWQKTDAADLLDESKIEDVIRRAYRGEVVDDEEVELDDDPEDAPEPYRV